MTGLLWEFWTRGFMGCKSRPYNLVWYLYLADKFCQGDHKALIYLMHWDHVHFNLPGTKAFNPRLPRGFKWCSMGDISQFIDDERGLGHCLKNSWQVHQQYLANCKAALSWHSRCSKKNLLPSQDCCKAWAGTEINVTPKQITKSATQG
jgi:hypothetical protein